MKTLNADFINAKNARSSAPALLAVFHFSSGDVFVSDRSLVPSGGPEFGGLVTSWGALSRPGSGLFEVGLDEMKIELANSGTPPFSSYVESHPNEETEVELFLWFEGLDYSKKEPVGRFVIASPVRYSGDGVSLVLVNSFIKKNRTIGRKISREDYPYADPDAIGRIENIIYGSPRNVPCHAIVAGAASALVSNITAGQTSGIELSLPADGLDFPSAGTLQVDAEKINYTGISSRILTGVTRGASGTAAAAHRKGAAAFEVRSDFTYLVAGHPLKSIGDVYVGGVRVVSGVTKQADSGGKAKVVLNSKFVLEKAVSLSVSEGSHSHDGASWAGAGSWTSATRWTAGGSPGWTAGQWQNYAFKDAASIVAGTDGNNYRCILAHTSATNNRPVTGASWATYWALDNSGVAGAAWASGVSYGTGGNIFFITASGTNYLDVASISSTALSRGAYSGSILLTQVENVYQDAVSGSFSVYSSGTKESLCDGNLTTFGALAVSGGYITTSRSFALSDKGTVIGARLCSAMGSTYTGTGKTAIEGGAFSGAFVQGGGSTKTTYRAAGTLQKSGAATWNDFSDMSLTFTWVSGGAATCWEQWVEVWYVPYGGGASPATGVALSGNSAADAVVGGPVTCDVDGYADDSSGTYTGTPGAVIENPADIFRHILINYLDVQATEIDASFIDARNSLSQAISGGYKFAGVIDRQADALDLLEDLSRQSRLKFSHNGKKAKLSFIRNSVAAADKVLDGLLSRKSSLIISRSGKDEIINCLDAHFLRDFSKSPAPENFKGLAGSSPTYPASGDAASVAAYGRRYPGRPFMFSFVRSSEMASDLRDFYITRYKDRKRRIAFTVFLDSFELEEGDVIELDYLSSVFNITGSRFFIEKVVYLPGSLLRRRADGIMIQAREL